MIVSFMKKAKGRYPAIASYSMDKGYGSSSNRKELDDLPDLNVMPKKGGRSREDRQRESAINNLQRRGLSWVRTHGEEGFRRTVALAVLAANVHRTGHAQGKEAEALAQGASTRGVTVRSRIGS